MTEGETVNVLSQKLQSFEGIYKDGNYSGMKQSQSNVISALQTTENRINSVIDGFARAGNDAQIDTLKKWLKLANSGISVLRRSVDSDLNSLFSEGDKLHSLIEENIENVTNASSQQHYINQGESQLQAMSDAINSVKLGIRGNMHKDGSLGNYVTFNQGYSFTLEPFNSKNETTGELAWWQKGGCLVVGGVEGVCKAFEGIGDYLLTGAAALCSVYPNDWVLGNEINSLGKQVENIVKADLSNYLASSAASLMGVSKEKYNSSIPRNIGKTIGYGVTNLFFLSNVFSALSFAGSAAELSLNNGLSSRVSFGIGTAVGVVSFIVRNKLTSKSSAASPSAPAPAPSAPAPAPSASAPAPSAPAPAPSAPAVSTVSAPKVATTAVAQPQLLLPAGKETVTGDTLAKMGLEKVFENLTP